MKGLAQRSNTANLSGWLKVLLIMPLLLSACDGGGSTSGGEVVLNEPGGLVISKPEFLLDRTLVETRVDIAVSVDVNGVITEARQLSAPQGDTRWYGEVYIPKGEDGILIIDWFESQVPGLPADLNGNLLLASYRTQILAIDENKVIPIDMDDYVTQSTSASPRPDLDLDRDGFGNLQERLAESRPNDAADKPADVKIFYNPTAPIIDGSYDEVWDDAQFKDQVRSDLLINKILVDLNVVQPGEDRRFRWGGLHDERYLYLLIFGERQGAQTPFGDSDQAYNDDSIDIYWDGNNSKGAVYDGVDDYHVIIPLLNDTGGANRSGTPGSRFQLGDSSALIDESAIDFAVCICKDAGQQLYEVRLDLQAANIPVDTSFGLEIQINNDVNGGERDAKWAWFNETGEDTTWRVPRQMGSARLAPQPPQP